MPFADESGHSVCGRRPGNILTLLQLERACIEFDDTLMVAPQWTMEVLRTDRERRTLRYGL
jgi:hypothetical protein